MKYCVTTVAAASMVLGLTAMVNAQAPAPAQPAQTTKPAPAGPLPVTQTTMPTWEASAGYQYLWVKPDSPEGSTEDSSSSSFPFGLAVDGSRNFGALGIVAEGGWSFKTEGEDPNDVTLNFWHVAGGVRWTKRSNPKVWPYVQGLVGAEIQSTSGDVGGIDIGDTTTHLMVQPGGGVTFVVGDGWGIFAAADYRRVFMDEEEFGVSGTNGFRVFAGFRMILD